MEVEPFSGSEASKLTRIEWIKCEIKLIPSSFRIFCLVHATTLEKKEANNEMKIWVEMSPYGSILNSNNDSGLSSFFSGSK